MRPAARSARTRHACGVFAALVMTLAVLTGGVPTAAEVPERPRVVRAVLDGQAITPVTTRYLLRVLRDAERDKVDVVVIELDTPGGLVDSTRKLVSGILESEVPVVTYVSPNGARAASAGLFIVLSSDVAAMAPATHIGAAHPVNIGGGTPDNQSSDESAPSVMDEKITNDTAAWARSLADLRGRDPDVAEAAVRKSVSLTSSEALKAGLVDVIANDVGEAIASIAPGEANIETQEMGLGERVLAFVADPNIALLLLMVGFYAILFELYSGGVGAAAVVGALCIVLGFAGLAVLPLTLVGVVLLLAAAGLLAAEMFVVSYGLLTAAGATCLVLGGLMLVDSPEGFLKVSMSVAISLAVAGAGIVAVLVIATAGARRGVALDPMLRASGAALEGFRPRGGHYAGTVRVRGEIWKARADSSLAEGAAIEVVSRKNLLLYVRPTHESEPIEEGAS